MNTTIVSILLGVGGMFGWGIYDFLGGVFAKQIGPFKSLFWSQLAGFFSLLLLALLSPSRVNASIWIIILITIAAVIYATGYLLFFKGFQIGNVSIVAAAMNLWAVFTMFFAFVFMGQRLTPAQTVGVLMIIAGATLASINWNEIRIQGFKLSAGVKEAALGAFFFGVFWNISEVVSEAIGWLSTTLFVKLGIILFLLLYALLANREMSLAAASTRIRLIVALMGIIEISAVALVNYGLVIGDAILITPISSALSIVTITLAVIFLKDRLTILQGVGVFMAIGGIVVTAF